MADRDFERGSVWGLVYDGIDGVKPVVIVSNDARNRSRFEWVHVVRLTSRPKAELPTIVPLSAGDAPLTGRAMCDEVELVPKGDLVAFAGFSGRVSERTMRRISQALRIVLDLDDV